MANGYNNNLTPCKSDKYGTHYACWCKEKTARNGNLYYEGFIWLPNNKGIKVTMFPANEGKDKKGNITHPIELTVFKSNQVPAVTL